MAAASNGSEYFEFYMEAGRESFARPSNAETVEQDEEDLKWAAIGRLPSQRQGSHTAVLRRSQTQTQTCGYADGNVVQTIDVKKLDRADREMLVRQALATSDQDNYKLLSAIKERLDRYNSGPMVVELLKLKIAKPSSMTQIMKFMLWVLKRVRML